MLRSLIAVLLLASVAVNAQPINLNDSAIHYLGRVTADKSFAWTGSGFEFGFSGSTLTLTFEQSPKTKAGQLFCHDGSGARHPDNTGGEVFQVVPHLS